ncbi:MAG TPA: hypothetical protein PL063_05430 [Candidatus Cloacimonadota bacterium]|nr:hypothetical protein [Candidatus Cloacimonadota bacterium]HQB41694.1 hypothetical protein [Candidatus Cloacimonadota bacterium]
MQKKIKYLVFSFLLIATACTNKYQSANVFYKAENYTVAIEEYDKVINKSANGYEVTLSEIDRSESYFQLGMRAFERNNYNLAIRLFYLANSDKADEKIIDSYLILIDDLKTKDERNRVIATYNYLIDNLYRSERTPLLIFERICLIYEWYQNEEKVWEDYSMLYEKYPESEYLPQAQEIVDNFLPKWIEALVAKKNSPDVDLDEIISSMVYLKTIPNNYHENISKEIALIYIQMAEELIKKQEYVTAEKQFRRALEYDIDQAVYVQKRLNYVCDMFVSEGNDLIKQKLIDEAIVSFNRSFQIIPDYQKAIDGIARAESRRLMIARSLELKNEGIQLERKKKYKEALAIYQQAYNLDNTPELSKLIFEVSNTIEIDKDPRSFALKILNEHNNGAIVKRINSLRAELKEEWKDKLKDSGWRPIGSGTRNTMEIRYDFITPEENYFLSWQVNMKDKKIIPLNKLTEKLFGK